MKKTDKIIADKILARQLSLERFTAGEKKKVFDLFLQMQAELKMKLANGFTPYEKTRLTKLLKDCTETINEFYTQLAPDAGTLVYKGLPKVDWRTGKDIIEIDATKAGKKAAGYFTNDRAVAQRFADTLTRPGDSHVVEAYVNIKNPFIIDAKGKAASGFMVDALNPLHNNPELMAALQSNKYDGLIIKNTLDEGTIYLPKTPQQIKVKNMGAPQSTDLLGLAKAEAAATQTAIASIGLEASLPSASVLKAMVSDTLLQGAPLSAWWAKQAEDTAFKFAAQVRQGMVQGETLQQIINRVVGNPNKGITGVMDIARRNASTLVHDSIMQISNDAKLATYRENADILNGVEWLSTFDMNTCETCAALNGAQWDLEGNPINGTTASFTIPPLHPNDRCVLTPVTKSYRELGIDIPEVTGLTRASDLGQIPAGTSFSDFLDRHSKAEQDKFFGKGKADMWREGKITLKDLVAQNGRPITLSQLNAGL